MSTFKRTVFAASVCLAAISGVSLAETPNFGKPMDEATIAPWDISILPDGTGLPKGSGTPAQGAPIFWPYSTTVFDFIRRAMPFQMPHSLTDDEVYALTAYILAGNKLIGPNDAMDAQTLPKVKMPYHDNFILRFPNRI
jgi:hypothetical protein